MKGAAYLAVLLVLWYGPAYIQRLALRLLGVDYEQ